MAAGALACVEDGCAQATGAFGRVGGQWALALGVVNRRES